MRKNLTIAIKKLDSDPEFPLPNYELFGSVGADVYSSSDFVVHPGQQCLVSTGFAVAVPRFYEAQIRTCGVVASKHKVIVSSVTTGIDTNNMEEVKVWLQNIGSNTFRGQRGMKVAQLVINPITVAKFVIVDDFSESQLSAIKKLNKEEPLLLQQEKELRKERKKSVKEKLTMKKAGTNERQI